MSEFKFNYDFLKKNATPGSWRRGYEYYQKDMVLESEPEKNFYKGNMHAHTTLSDGKQTPEEVKELAELKAKIGSTYMKDFNFHTAHIKYTVGKTLVEMLGAIPIPNERNGMKNFLATIKNKIKKGYSITIFPEAHIWPYYTKIRPFKNVSFRYPIEHNAPVFSVTNTYQKRGKNKVKITTYVDGPFFPDSNLTNIQDKKQNLRDKVYNAMVERSKNSDFEYIKYIKK